MPTTSINYRAPELDVFNPGWNAGVDVWSIGCLLVEMYSGKADMLGGILAANHPAPDTDSGMAVRAAAFPSLQDLGRCPLFKAESSFEHLAMVERCVGTLPPSIYEVLLSTYHTVYVHDSSTVSLFLPPLAMVKYRVSCNGWPLCASARVFCAHIG